MMNPQRSSMVLALGCATAVVVTAVGLAGCSGRPTQTQADQSVTAQDTTPSLPDSDSSEPTSPSSDSSPTDSKAVSPSTVASRPRPQTPAATRSSTPSQRAMNAAALQTMLSDMVGRHDTAPRGVPHSYGYYKGATPSDGSWRRFQAINIWGQLFAPEDGRTTYGARVQIRNPHLYFLMPSGWQAAKIPSGSYGAVGGAYWRGDFQPSAHTDATSRKDGAGTYSVPLRPLAKLGQDAYHFWWNGLYPRVSIPAGAKGIAASMQLRLIPDGGSGSLAGTRFIAGISSDLYANPRVMNDSDGINDAMASPRMKFVTGSWQTFYAATLSPDELRAAGVPTP